MIGNNRKIHNFIIKALSSFIIIPKYRRLFRNKYIIKKYGITPAVKGYEINGCDNKIIVVENGSERLLQPGERIDELDIAITGNNNTIKLHLPIRALSSSINILNHNCNIDIGSTYCFRKVEIVCRLGDSQSLVMGGGTNIIGAEIILEEKSRIEIGENCLFSSKILVRSSDGHSVLDQQTGKVINETADLIKIGNHVWIGTEVMILKNSMVADNSIIAARCVVTKKFTEQNIVLAGVPAKIVKQGVNWRIENPWMLENGKFLE